jgi:hypothetical protein
MPRSNEDHRGRSQGRYVNPGGGKGRGRQIKGEPGGTCIDAGEPRGPPQNETLPRNDLLSLLDGSEMFEFVGMD